MPVADAAACRCFCTDGPSRQFSQGFVKENAPWLRTELASAWECVEGVLAGTYQAYLTDRIVMQWRARQSSHMPET